VRLALEVHGGIMANSAEMLRTMEEVSRPSVGINFDTANILYYDDALDAPGALRELEAVVAHVSHVHLKDFVRGETRETNSLPVLGRGVVDFRGVFDILHRAGFDGVFSLEVETFHGVTEGDDIAAYHRDVLDSIECLRSLGEFSPGGVAA
jgi:sugar phosphate isomerase/epimerase